MKYWVIINDMNGSKTPTLSVFTLWGFDHRIKCSLLLN